VTPAQTTVENSVTKTTTQTPTHTMTQSTETTTVSTIPPVMAVAVSKPTVSLTTVTVPKPKDEIDDIVSNVLSSKKRSEDELNQAAKSGIEMQQSMELMNKSQMDIQSSGAPAPAVSVTTLQSAINNIDKIPSPSTTIQSPVQAQQ